MVFTTGAVVWPILTASAVLLAWGASFIGKIFKIAFGTLLHANIQVQNSYMARRAREAIVLSRSCAGIAGFVARLTQARHIAETSRGAIADTSSAKQSEEKYLKKILHIFIGEVLHMLYLLIHSFVSTSNAFVRTFSIAPLVVTLLIAILLSLFLIQPVIVLANIRLLPIKTADGLFRFRASE